MTTASSAVKSLVSKTLDISAVIAHIAMVTILRWFPKLEVSITPSTYLPAYRVILTIYLFCQQARAVSRLLPIRRLDKVERPQQSSRQLSLCFEVETIIIGVSPMIPVGPEYIVQLSRLTRFPMFRAC